LGHGVYLHQIQIDIILEKVAINDALPLKAALSDAIANLKYFRSTTAITKKFIQHGWSRKT